MLPLACNAKMAAGLEDRSPFMAGELHGITVGKTATFTAPAAGTYKFHCNIHNFMKAVLIVS